MQIVTDINKIQLTTPTVLTIGTFDGVHRGHQALLAQLRTAAARRQAASAVIAFHPRPKRVLAPHLPNNDYLTTPAERIALFEHCGLDTLILTPFTLEFAEISAYDFVKLLVDRLNLVELWCGHDFALGKNREGDVARLTELGRQFGYTVHEFDPLLIDGMVISSTKIRQLLGEGEVRQATQLMGRFPSISGPVVPGDRRGRTLGFPTANLDVPAERLLPANGVYATLAHLPGRARPYQSVTNVGVRPSFDDKIHTVEAYLFDFSSDIYGDHLTLDFVERLRPEMKFDNIEQLKAQIARDSAAAQKLLTAEMARKNG